MPGAPPAVAKAATAPPYPHQPTHRGQPPRHGDRVLRGHPLHLVQQADVQHLGHKTRANALDLQPAKEAAKEAVKHSEAAGKQVTALGTNPAPMLSVCRQARVHGMRAIHGELFTHQRLPSSLLFTSQSIPHIPTAAHHHPNPNPRPSAHAAAATLQLAAACLVVAWLAAAEYRTLLRLNCHQLHAGLVLLQVPPCTCSTVQPWQPGGQVEKVLLCERVVIRGAGTAGLVLLQVPPAACSAAVAGEQVGTSFMGACGGVGERAVPQVFSWRRHNRGRQATGRASRQAPSKRASQTPTRDGAARAHARHQYVHLPS